MGAHTSILYSVATPLGNLADLSDRAKNVLGEVSVVAAEDTRRTRGLLSHLQVSPKLVSYHAHSPPARREEILAWLVDGQSVALVTDAGTPAISDPGAQLVALAHDRGVTVVPVPGPSAVATALSAAGFQADRFLFLGFPPKKGKDRSEWLDQVADSRHTVVAYESPERLVRLLTDLVSLGDGARLIAVSRELTKVYEEIRRGTLDEMSGYYQEHPIRGEITLVIDRATPKAGPDQATIRAEANALLKDGHTRKETASLLAESLGISRNEAYKVVTSL